MSDKKNSRADRKKLQRHAWCGELGIPHTLDRGVISAEWRKQNGR